MPFQQSFIQEVDEMSEDVTRAPQAQATPRRWDHGYLKDACVRLASRDEIHRWSGERLATHVILRDTATGQIHVLHIGWEAEEPNEVRPLHPSAPEIQRW